MIKEKIILTDCDGVLLDWIGGFKEWMEARGFYQNEGADALYTISDKYGFPDREVGRHWSRIFNESAACGYLNPMPNALEGMASLIEDGWKFIVITSLSRDPYAGRLREERLKFLFGENTFIKVICLDSGEDKDDVLAEYANSGLLWVEDKPENVLIGKALGLNAVMIRHDHNEKEEAKMAAAGIPVVNDWLDIVKIVNSDADTLSDSRTAG